MLLVLHNACATTISDHVLISTLTTACIDNSMHMTYRWSMETRYSWFACSCVSTRAPPSRSKTPASKRYVALVPSNSWPWHLAHAGALSLTGTLRGLAGCPRELMMPCSALLSALDNSHSKWREKAFYFYFLLREATRLLPQRNASRTKYKREREQHRGVRRTRTRT